MHHLLLLLLLLFDVHLQLVEYVVKKKQSLTSGKSNAIVSGNIDRERRE